MDYRVKAMQSKNVTVVVDEDEINDIVKNKGIDATVLIAGLRRTMYNTMNLNRDYNSRDYDLVDNEFRLDNGNWTYAIKENYGYRDIERKVVRAATTQEVIMWSALKDIEHSITAIALANDDK